MSSKVYVGYFGYLNTVQANNIKQIVMKIFKSLVHRRFLYRSFESLWSLLSYRSPIASWWLLERFPFSLLKKMVYIAECKEGTFGWDKFNHSWGVVFIMDSLVGCVFHGINSLRQTANGKNKIKLLPSIFSCLNSRVKICVFVVNSRSLFSIFEWFI